MFSRYDIEIFIDGQSHGLVPNGESLTKQVADTEKVKIEKIRSQTEKDLQTAQLNFLRDRELRMEERYSKDRFRKGLGFTIKIFMIVALVFGVSFLLVDIPLAVLFLIQGVVFACALLSGLQIVVKKSKTAHHLAIILFAAGLIFFVPQFARMGAHPEILEKTSEYKTSTERQYDYSVPSSSSPDLDELKEEISSKFESAKEAINEAIEGDQEK